MIDPVQDVCEAEGDERRSAWCQRGSRRTRPGLPWYWKTLSAPSGVMKRSTVVVRIPRWAHAGSIEKRDSDDVMGVRRPRRAWPVPASARWRGERRGGDVRDGTVVVGEGGVGGEGDAGAGHDGRGQPHRLLERVT